MVNDIKWVQLNPGVLRDAADEYTAWLRVLAYTDDGTWTLGRDYGVPGRWEIIGRFSWIDFEVVSTSTDMPI